LEEEEEGLRGGLPSVSVVPPEGSMTRGAAGTFQGLLALWPSAGPRRPAARNLSSPSERHSGGVRRRAPDERFVDMIT